MKIQVFCSIFISLMVISIPLAYGSGEIDALAIVNNVIGDDTFETENQELIKLADIDPTCADIDNSTGFISAKSVLASFIEGKTVYLDIDDLFGTDYSGTGNRTVAVVYVDFNSTHYLNVNNVMLQRKLLEANDQDNDFTPENWTMYIKKQDISEFPVGTTTTVCIILLITGAIVLKKLHKNVL